MQTSRQDRKIPGSPCSSCASEAGQAGRVEEFEGVRRSGSGILVPILPKTTFDFSFLGIGESYSTIVVPALAVAPYSQVILMVRTHARMITNAGFGFTVNLFEVDPSTEDGADFIVSGSAYLTSTLIDSAVTPPTLTKNIAATKPGPYLRVVVRGEMPSGAAGDLVGTISADLLCRSRL